MPSSAMPPDLALRRRAALTDSIPQAWRLPLLYLALAWGLLFALFAPALVDMARQYWDSSTYNHVLFVPLILGWLVKLRSPELAKLTPQAFWPGLLLLAGALFLWLLGDISGLALATHLALVLALQACVISMLGVRVTAALLFPLVYMLFLVPFGDELVPTLQTITAKLTIALTHWSGVPAQINGVFIDTPAGLFEVAEACSGVKFLIAMVALGTLAAHVCFASWRRRAIFMAGAVALPILANGVRAWGTIYIAQSQGIAFAAGFDHIFYGWVFFALVMALLLALAWPFFDRPSDDGFINAEALAASPLLGSLAQLTAPLSRCLLVAAMLSLGFMGWANQARQLQAPMPQQIALPPVAGWTQAELAPGPLWQPRAQGADHRLIGSYTSADGARVDVFYALYAAQDDGREAGAYGEGALVPGSDWRWHSAGPDFAANMGDGISERLQAGGNVQRLTLTLFRHRGLLTGSVGRLKLSNIRDRLTFDPHPTGLLILSASDGGAVSAADAITRFAASTGDLGEWMDHIGQAP